MAYAALAEVTTGWTGSIAVTYSGVTTTVTPRTRESIASMFARLVADVAVDSGLALTVKVVTNDPFIACSAASSFTLTLSGTCETRSGITGGPYTGVYIEGTDPASVTVPVYGLRLDGTDLRVEEGRMTSAGTYAAAGVMQGTQVPLRVWTTHADAWAAEADLEGVYDVWHDGRVFGRVRIDGWKRSPPGRLRSGMIILDADAQAVAE